VSALRRASLPSQLAVRCSPDAAPAAGNQRNVTRELIERHGGTGLDARWSRIRAGNPGVRHRERRPSTAWNLRAGVATRALIAVRSAAARGHRHSSTETVFE
jgi:hypothetical protein